MHFETSGGNSCRIGPYLVRRRFQNRHSSGDVGKTATHFRATPPWWATCSWAHQGGIEAIPDLVLADRRVAVKRAFQNEWRIIVQNQNLSGAMPFQKPPLVQKCSKTATHLKRCNGPNGCRARKCIKSRHSPRNSIVLGGRSVRGRGKPAARSGPAPLQAAATAAVNKRGTAGRYTSAAPWSHFLPGHSATFQKLRRRGPCAWSFPLDTHPGLPQRFAARCPCHLDGRSGTRKAT